MKKSEQTKEKLANTLILLLNKQPIDLITVQELCNRAQVGRTAFYNNFHNKEDVLKYIYRRAHKETFLDKFKDEHYLTSDEYIFDMIDFFDHHTLLLSSIIRWNLIDYVAKYNTETVMEYIQSYQDDTLRNYADYYMCYSSVAIFHMCIMWIGKNKDISSQELFNLIKSFRSYDHK